MASNIMGNKVLPGVVDGNSFRPAGALWRSGSEKNYFEVNQVTGGVKGDAVPFATIVKQTGLNTFMPITEAEIASLDARLGIIVDESFVYGDESNDEIFTANIGLRGEVDQAQLLVGDKTFGELSDANKLALKKAFYKGGIELVPVYQA